MSSSSSSPSFSGPPATLDDFTFTFGTTAIGQTSGACFGFCYCSDASNCTCDRSGTWSLEHDLSPPFSAFNYRLQPFSGPSIDCYAGTAVQLPVVTGPGQQLTYNVEFSPTRTGTFSDYLTLSGLTLFVSGSTPASGGPCQPSATVLCLDDTTGDRRFQVTVAYSTSEAGGLSGNAQAISLVPVNLHHGGLFWFFGSDNPEMLVKVINGCLTNGDFWVFFSAGTNVGFTVNVVDTATGASKTYTNRDLTAAPPVQDTAAFSCSG